MLEKNLLLTVTLAVLTFYSSAQEIDNTAPWKNINSDSYIRLCVDNDYFTGTDEQYSEGTNLEIVMSWISKFPLSKLLVHPRFDNIKYGAGLEQAGYTPFALPGTGYPYGDRPFAGTFFLKTFLIATDTQKKQRLATTLSTGVIGPASLAGVFQDDAHVITGNVQPPGWQYQIRNDAIINYQVNYEKQVFSLPDYLVIEAEAMARAGTLSDKACAGLTVMAGHFESPYALSKTWRSCIQVYMYDNPEIEIVGYDATLQGGMFDHSSPYTLPASDISRVQFTNRIGLVVVIGRWYLEYNEYYVTQQFSTGYPHLWGGIQVAIAIDEKKSSK